MARSADSFKRQGKKFKAQALTLVICEDTHSSKTYFEEASRHFRSFAQVEFSHCGHTDPFGIVRAAVKRAENYDRVFCVIDRDTHDKNNFQQAIELGQSSPRVTVLTSYPCFEVWLLLHFRYSRSPYVAAGKASAGDRVIKDLQSIPEMEKYAKGSIQGLFTQLLTKLDHACRNGARSVQDAELDGEPNPSTPLHQLIKALESLGTPEPLNV